MSKICDLTGKSYLKGNKVSHSNKKSIRKFNSNLQEKKIYIPEEDTWIRMKVSTSAMRTIDKKGITAVLKEAQQKGLIKIY